MKNDYYQISLLIIICTWAFVMIVSVLGIFIFKLPTTSENAEIRKELINNLTEVTGAAIAIISMVIATKLKNKNDNNKID